VQGSVVEEDVASGARIFWVPRPRISGARSFMGDMFVGETSGARSSYVSCVVSLKSRVIPRYLRTRVLRGTRVGYPGRVVGLGWSGRVNRLGPNDLDGLW
jgi:hypothetical protein